MTDSPQKILVFQPTIGTYRIDFFNMLAKCFDLKIYIEYDESAFEIYNPDLWKNLLLCHPNILQKSIKLKKRQLYKGYWSIIESYKPDIILVSEFGINAIASLAYKQLYRKKYKVISICDDSYDMLNNRRDFSKYHRILRKLIVPCLDNIILVEPESQRWYQEHYNKGIFFPIISDEARLRIEYEQALEISNKYITEYSLKGKKIFLYVGRLIEIKNVESLIKAFKKIHSDDSKLVIVGDGNQANYLKELSSDNNNILFTGRLHGKELNAWYNIANALILPSFVEPFGAVTNEALIGGCKVLISNRAGSKCLIKNGINGFYINPADINDIAMNMQEALSTSIECPESAKLRKSLMLHSFNDLFSDLIADISR